MATKSAFTVKDIPSQAGKLAVVTGATGGLGYETAVALAGAGARVVLAARNPAKGADALARIRAVHPAADIRFELLDLASLASVAAFAERLNGEGAPLDILVNNAGIMALPTRQTTVDRFEAQLGVNYLSHFALTARLLPLLRAAPAPRVVNLSSLAHRSGRIDFSDLQEERGYKPWKAYTQSKLAMLMFALELQRRGGAGGWGLMSNAAHPGFARTELIPNGPGGGGVMGLASALLLPLASHSAAAGALPTLLAATSPLARPAEYYGPDGVYEMKGPPAPARIMPHAQDRAVAARLWSVSETLTGVRFPI
jgi:NAD(P)-dependent dehydrogenase (short-subunit alcohol dehydrogenase family)